MRKILFRGKRNGYAEQRDRDWLEGSLLVGDNGECEICYGTPRVRITYSVIPETVGQFTGLTDKNGKKIFEGDIVEYNDGLDYFKGEVVFESGAFGIGSGEVTDEVELYYCKVIGNIHDNPELMRAQS